MRNALAALQATPVSQRDAAALERAIHTLKSTSATLGAISFAQRCEELEEIAHTDPLKVTKTMLSQLETKFETVKSALLQQQQLLNSTQERS
jgi:HPt (histidine-containing phosphotransfer) domain-containing protein